MRLAKLVTVATLVTVALGAVACGSEVDPAELPSIEGYRSWNVEEVAGEVAGHGDTLRKIYINDLGREYTHSGPYVAGTVFVKESYDLGSDGQAGALRAIDIMRKVFTNSDDLETDVGGVPIRGGWAFTHKSDPEGDESYSGSCWNSCHQQAPIDGAWLDWGE